MVRSISLVGSGRGPSAVPMVHIIENIRYIKKMKAAIKLTTWGQNMVQ